MEITFDSLLSGTIGALIATVLAVLWQHVSLVAQRRFEVMLLVVDYLDELYFQFRHIEQYKERLYKENREIMTDAEYRALAIKMDSMLTSSRLRARVALVYGDNSDELYHLDTLLKKLTEAALLLFQASADTWDEKSAQFRRLFDQEIERLRRATESQLLRGARMCAVILTPAMRCFRTGCRLCPDRAWTSRNS